MTSGAAEEKELGQHEAEEAETTTAVNRTMVRWSAEGLQLRTQSRLYIV